MRQLDLSLTTLNPAEKAGLIGQRWPNLERLQLDLDELALPNQKCRDLILTLGPLTRLRDLCLSMGALLLPEGQELVLRQLQLRSLCTISSFVGDGATDGLLQVVGRLSYLTRLDTALSTKPFEWKNSPGRLAPHQQQPATDEGVRFLSSLQSLKDLRLTVQAFDFMITGQLMVQVSDYTITGQALTTVGSLHQLTHLSLWGWPIVDTDLVHLTHLQLMSLESCTDLTKGCLMHLCPVTTLRSLSLANSPLWNLPMH